jgi:Ca-activated chloride channel homolog
MIFADPFILLFLWVIPLLIFIWVICEKLRKRALERFANPELHRRLTGEPAKGRKFITYVMLLTAIGLMVIALSGPRWGFYYRDQRGVDIMMVADVSKSMLANDVAPTRLHRARREISDFLNMIQGDRAGLIAFAGDAFVQCPLTQDYGALTMFLDLLDPELIPVPGTDLGVAIELGVSSFDYNVETDKVIFLLTDGEDHEGGGLAAAKKASKMGVKIFVLGIGETAGAPVPDTTQGESFKTDHQGKTILSKPDIEGLKKIAAATDGIYVQSTGGSLDLETLYLNGIKARTKDAALKNVKLKVPKERFAFFLVPAILLLMAETLIFRRRQALIMEDKQARC